MAEYVLEDHGAALRLRQLGEAGEGERHGLLPDQRLVGIDRVVIGDFAGSFGRVSPRGWLLR
jgi:hypothetical protein